MKKNKRNEKKKYFLSVMVGTAAVIVAVFVVLAFVIHGKGQVSAINSFAECAEKYPVAQSYPEVCTTPDGKTFTNQ